MKIKLKEFRWILINYILCIISILMFYFLKNNISSLKIIGLFIIIVSILMMLKYRRFNSISLLIGIISLISISFAYSICFNTYSTVFNWQIPLLQTEENIINVKNYLVFISFLFLSIGNFDLSKTSNSKKFIKFDYNSLIVIASSLILLYALIFGFDRGIIGMYVSNSNPLYEYALIIFLFAWQYSKDSRIFKFFLIIYAILYVLQGLIFGDRSSAFPMILLILILYTKNNIKMKNVGIVGIIGIFAANVIDIFRKTGILFNDAIVKETLSRGLFVNTISYSFYGGTQILRYGISLSFREKMLHLFNYFISIFIGGSNKYSLTTIANANNFTNKGGGMSLTYFYFWGGIAGSILFAIIMGRIINYIFSHNDKLNNILKITLTIFTIRWFIYYPVAFFRTAIFIPIICYYIFLLFNKMLKKT